MRKDKEAKEGVRLTEEGKAARKRPTGETTGVSGDSELAAQALLLSVASVSTALQRR